MADEKKTPTPVSKAPVEAKAEPVEVKADVQHGSYVPTEADYEKARTVGAGNEPELPPGVVRK